MKIEFIKTKKKTEKSFIEKSKKELRILKEAFSHKLVILEENLKRVKIL